MFVEIKGVNFINKGAELMLYAIVERLRSHSSNIIPAVGLRDGTFQQRREANVAHLLRVDTRKYPKIATASAVVIPKILPRRFRRKYSLVSESEISCVLDASGFSYSDQWGPRGSEYMEMLLQRWRLDGKKVVLLPQAFGPFEGSRIRRAFSSMLENIDLVFARDPISYNNIVTLVGERPNVKLAPDFTILVEGIVPDYASRLKGRACVIPNFRMVDKGGVRTEENYVTRLSAACERLFEHDLEPFLLIHETKSDARIAQQISDRIRGIEIVEESNSLFIKGIIGQSHLVVGSRFHGLVNGLAQSVPCIATGWSHKYEMLMRDFECLECLCDLESDDIVQVVDYVVNPKNYSDLVHRLSEAGKRLKKQVHDMWDQVFELLES